MDRQTRIKILKRAYSLLRKGWTKETYFDEHTGCYCLHGAISQAYEDVTGYVFYSLGNTPINRFAANKGYTVDWNDAKNRTKAQVLNAVKRLMRGSAA